ncbi:prolyl oligopeptidase family serine peptidase [Candidatus Latescibacterota bacterium]
MEILVKYVLENYPIDPQRIYLSGSSMGGAGTWLVANHNPDLYAALVPCMGGGRNREEIVETITLERLKNVPVWAFSGRIDKSTPIEFAIELEEGLTSIGGNIRHTIYEDMGHQGPSDEAYNQEETYIWLMSHKKGSITSNETD